MGDKLIENMCLLIYKCCLLNLAHDISAHETSIISNVPEVKLFTIVLNYSSSFE